MILDRNESKEVAVLLGAGSMGLAILRRVAAGKKILLGDISEQNLARAANELRYSGYDVVTKIADACDKASLEALAAEAAECKIIIPRQHREPAVFFIQVVIMKHIACIAVIIQYEVVRCKISDDLIGIEICFQLFSLG